MITIWAVLISCLTLISFQCASFWQLTEANLRRNLGGQNPPASFLFWPLLRCTQRRTITSIIGCNLTAEAFICLFSAYEFASSMFWRMGGTKWGGSRKRAMRKERKSTARSHRKEWTPYSKFCLLLIRYYVPSLPLDSKECVVVCNQW